MGNETITAKLVKRAKNKKGFVLEGYEGWFNASSKVAPFLEKIVEGTTIEVAYFSNGVFRTVTMIKAVEEQKSEAPKTGTEEKKATCAVCGKELKNPKYPTCWNCKDKVQKAEKPKEEVTQEKSKETQEPPKKETNTFIRTNYGSPEDIAGKEVGCAAGCAASILSGRQEDPETLLEMFRILANGILEHIRNSK